MIRTRHIALLYLPTVGVWSVVRAVQFYRRDPGYHGHRPVWLRIVARLLSL